MLYNWASSHVPGVLPHARYITDTCSTSEPYVVCTSVYLGYLMMPAYTFWTTKAPSQTRWFERPILITLLEHHMISSDIKDCNFTLLWSWNTPVMPVLTSGPTTRSLENKGLSKESIMQDGSASNTLWVGFIKWSTQHVYVISTSACCGLTVTSYDIIWHHMTSYDI